MSKHSGGMLVLKEPLLSFFFFFECSNNITYYKDLVSCVQYIYCLVFSWVCGIVLLVTKEKKKVKNEM